MPPRPSRLATEYPSPRPHPVGSLLDQPREEGSSFRDLPPNSAPGLRSVAVHLRGPVVPPLRVSPLAPRLSARAPKRVPWLPVSPSPPRPTHGRLSPRCGRPRGIGCRRTRHASLPGRPARAFCLGLVGPGVLGPLASLAAPRAPVAWGWSAPGNLSPQPHPVRRSLGRPRRCRPEGEPEGEGFPGRPARACRLGLVGPGVFVSPATPCASVA